MAHMRVAESLIARYTLRDDGILVADDLNPELPRTTAAVDETMDVLLELIEGKPRPVLWRLGLDRSYPEGWAALIRRAPEATAALAIVVTEETRSVLGSFPATMDALLFPVRVFDNDTEAFEWLGNYAVPPVAG